MGQVTYNELQARPYLHDQRLGKIANLPLQCENPYVSTAPRSCDHVNANFIISFRTANDVMDHCDSRNDRSNSGFLTSPIRSPRRPPMVSKSDYSRGMFYRLFRLKL